MSIVYNYLIIYGPWLDSLLKIYFVSMGRNDNYVLTIYETFRPYYFFQIHKLFLLRTHIFEPYCLEVVIEHFYCVSNPCYTSTNNEIWILTNL